MAEYALMRGDRIVNMVTSQKSLSSLQLAFSAFTVVPIDEVSPIQLRNYRYWQERP